MRQRMQIAFGFRDGIFLCRCGDVERLLEIPLSCFGASLWRCYSAEDRTDVLECPAVLVDECNRSVNITGQCGTNLFVELCESAPGMSNRVPIICKYGLVPASGSCREARALESDGASG